VIELAATKEAYDAIVSMLELDTVARRPIRNAKSEYLIHLDEKTSSGWRSYRSGDGAEPPGVSGDTALAAPLKQNAVGFVRLRARRCFSTGDAIAVALQKQDSGAATLNSAVQAAGSSTQGRQRPDVESRKIAGGLTGDGTQRAAFVWLGLTPFQLLGFPYPNAPEGGWPVPARPQGHAATAQTRGRPFRSTRVQRSYPRPRAAPPTVGGFLMRTKPDRSRCSTSRRAHDSHATGRSAFGAQSRTRHAVPAPLRK
jgi:hypothetical protein